MRLSSALKDKKFDVRLQDKMVAEGKLSQDEIKKHLTSLPDDSKSVTYTESPTEEGEAQ